MVSPQHSDVDGKVWTQNNGFAGVHRLDSARAELRPRNNDENFFFTNRTYFAAREHPAGLIRDGGKQFGLFTMSGSPAAISSLPQIVIANDVSPDVRNAT